MSELCTDEKIQTLVDKMTAGRGDDIANIDILLADYPDDPRLHFMKGSVLVGEGKLIEAHSS
jgi:hypothetical protein